MTGTDLKKLIERLGRRDAIAELERSALKNAELLDLARQVGIEIDKRTVRRQIAIDLVMSDTKRIDRSHESLMSMTDEELKEYFADRQVSNREVMELLREMGLAPTGKIPGKIADYATREIAALGVFQRIASGKSRRQAMVGG